MIHVSWTVLSAAIVLGYAIWNPAAAIAEEFKRPALDADGLLPPDRNPASVPPEDAPETTDASLMVPAVAMSDQVRTAILLFDSADVSERKYDLVTCLDGLTFGFGNWPQAEVGQFFSNLFQEAAAKQALIERSMALFESERSAWQAFRRDASISAENPDQARVESGIRKLLAESTRRNVDVGSQQSGKCSSQLSSGRSLYQDYDEWLVPLIKLAFRDPAIVAFQVRYWEADVIEPARRHARSLGLPDEGVFLMAFYQSNPGQAPNLRRAVQSGRAPDTLRAGGKDWRWKDPPSNLAEVSEDQWHLLLVWQAMCPRPSSRFRIRNRNLAFFTEYLSETFRLPHESMRSGSARPEADEPDNCDPGKVARR